MCGSSRSRSANQPVLRAPSDKRDLVGDDLMRTELDDVPARATTAERCFSGLVRLPTSSRLSRTAARATLVGLLSQLQLIFQAILLLGAKHLIFKVDAEDLERIERKIDEIRTTVHA